FIVQALRGEDITIYGDGTQTRSFCYVDDMVEGLLRYMDLDGEEPGPLNLGNPTEVEIGALAEKILKLTGSRSKLIFQPLPDDDPKQRQPDISKARALIDWEPAVPLDSGLRETVDYFGKLLAH
ncbi:MAG: NAD-dependent epimerase/dehydratase family protein, partial [Bauldia litoralis]